MKRRALPDAFRRRANRPAVVGHRGVRGPRPENTIEAIEEAHRQGADAVEIDVRLCATGEVVVFHDPDLAQLAGDARLVARVGLAELRRFDLGDAARIPTLDQVIEVVAARGLGLNVEIKHDAESKPRTVAAVAAILRRRAPEVRAGIVVSSFDPWVLVAHRALVPALCHALLVHESTYHDWALRIARRLPIDGVHIEASLAVPARARPFFQRGFVSAWTINDPTRARAAFDLGLEALITDTPQALRQAFPS